MKRKEFLKHLNKNECVLLREGANHSWFVNTQTGLKSAVPRHPEIKDLLANAICKQLGIPKIK